MNKTSQICGLTGIILTTTGIALAAEDNNHKTQNKNSSAEKKQKQAPRIMSIEEGLRKSSSPSEIARRRRLVGSVTGYVPYNFSPLRTSKYMGLMLKLFWNDLSGKVKQYTPLEDYVNKYYGKYMNNPLVKADIPLEKRHEDIKKVLYSDDYSENEKATRVFLHLLGTTRDSLKNGITKEKNNHMYKMIKEINKYYDENPAYIDGAKKDAKEFISGYRDILNVFK